MPPLARAVEPEHTVSRSRTVTRPAPSRARWYAVLTPMMPAPTITISAVSVISSPQESPRASARVQTTRAPRRRVLQFDPEHRRQPIVGDAFARRLARARHRAGGGRAEQLRLVHLA